MKEVKIIVKDVDGYSRTVSQELVAKLREQKLYRKDYLFSVVDGTRAEELKVNGNYRRDDAIYAYSKNELLDTGEGSIIDFLDEYKQPAIAVWNNSLFEKSFGIDWRYIFKNTDKKLEALIAIVHVLEADQ